MKKIKLSYLSILTLLFINILLTSCSKDENIVESQKIEPELYTNFNLIDGSSANLAKKDPGIKVTLSVGRKSKNCKKVGICKVKEITIEYLNSEPLEGMTFVSEQIDGQNYLILALTSDLDSDKFDTNFYIDEDVIDEESGLVIPVGTYNLDDTVGNYGGYKVLLKK